MKKLMRNRLAAIGLTITALMTLIAIFAPLIATHSPNQMDVAHSLAVPGTDGHLLGTDNYGRDLFSRLVYGARISLMVGIAAVIFGAFFGTLLGLVSGYFGGRLDAIIM
ncbi:ABC transporter permease, partial [Alkalihalophilus lindianensis]|nr:ABC transporter permease [Alkalihalophilus lindianensis]